MSNPNPAAVALLESVLSANGYHGLYLDEYDDDDCYCVIGNLIPCADTPFFCRAGYYQTDGTIGKTPPATTADLEEESE